MRPKAETELLLQFDWSLTLLGKSRFAVNSYTCIVFSAFWYVSLFPCLPNALLFSQYNPVDTQNAVLTSLPEKTLFKVRNFSARGWKVYIFEKRFQTIVFPEVFLNIHILKFWLSWMSNFSFLHENVIKIIQQSLSWQYCTREGLSRRLLHWFRHVRTLPDRKCQECHGDLQISVFKIVTIRKQIEFLHQVSNRQLLAWEGLFDRQQIFCSVRLVILLQKGRNSRNLWAWHLPSRSQEGEFKLWRTMTKLHFSNLSYCWYQEKAIKCSK